MVYHLDPRMPPREACVQRHQLERWAAEQPDKVFAIFMDGTSWTYAETLRQAIQDALIFVGLQAEFGGEFGADFTFLRH